MSMCVCAPCALRLTYFPLCSPLLHHSDHLQSLVKASMPLTTIAYARVSLSLSLLRVACVKSQEGIWSGSDGGSTQNAGDVE